MLRLLANVVFAVGYVVGTVKWRMGIVVRIPERHRR